MKKCRWCGNDLSKFNNPEKDCASKPSNVRKALGLDYKAYGYNKRGKKVS